MIEQCDAFTDQAYGCLIETVMEEYGTVSLYTP
jgi:hypothetical protein